MSSAGLDAFQLGNMGKNELIDMINEEGGFDEYRGVQEID